MCQPHKIFFIKVQFKYSNILSARFDKSTQLLHNSIMEQFYDSKYFHLFLKITSFYDSQLLGDTDLLSVLIVQSLFTYTVNIT